MARRVRLLTRVPESPFLPQPVIETKKPLSVLLVEDHDGMRTALRDWLLTSFPPLRLREARSMEEALRLAGQAALDVVLMNLELPGPNGIEATRALRRQFPGCRIIMTSVHDSAALRVAALEAGAEAFVSKRELPHCLLALLSPLLQKL